MSEHPEFDPGCKACPRLVSFLQQVRGEHPSYHCAPVPPFGASAPRLLVVGLAPGMHGANATGRPFTGDYAGILLYKALFKFGFSSRETSVSANDGLRLRDCRITNAVKCLPPLNKPTGAEVRTCSRYLRQELAGLRRGATVLALGTVAHQSVLRALGLKGLDFRHGAVHPLPGERWLVDSYHCSRYNVNTRRLTEAAFDAVLAEVRRLIPSLVARD